MIKLECLFFNNKWNFSSSKKYYKYPSANNRDIFVVKDCNKKDLDRVIKSSKVGLSIWESKQRTVRARFIRKVSDLILSSPYTL
jgi:acyl-CoA reductase-like NAD-dependent aldehyde dehydrogenase